MGATLVSSTPEPLPPFTGKNFAPKRELDQLKNDGRVTDPSTLTIALQLRYNDYCRRDEQAWKEYIDIGRCVSNLRNGKLLLMRSITDGRYLFVKKDGRFSDNKTVGGLFQFYSTKLTAEWLSSRPERDPVCPDSDDQIEALIANVKIVQDYYNRRFFDDNYEEQESLSAQDFGTWVTRYRYDPDKKDIECELLDFPACRWDMRFRAEESSYFLYESRCSNAVLEHILNANIPEDSSGSYESYGLEVIEQIARQGGNVAGHGKDSPYGDATPVQGENTVTEMWLQPEAYCDIDVSRDESTIGGVKIPKGQSLLEIFPDGLCAVGINGFKTIIGLYGENHKDHIVSGIYHLQSFSGVGKGISDAVDVKKEMDDLHSQTMAYIKAHSTPATYYNQDMITEEQARNIGKPRKNIPVDFSNAPDGVNSINQAIQSLTPQNPAGSIFQYKDVLNNWLQMSMQVTDFSNGLPGVDNKTATGAKIGDANAEMVLVPQHRNKADHRRRSDKVIFNLFKKYVNKDKWFATRSKNGITAGRYLSSSAFNDVDIDFEIVANSEVAKTPLQTQQNLSQLLNFTGGVAGLIQAVQMNPDITGEVATAFGVKLSIPSKTDIARVCRRRLEQAKELLKTELTNQQFMAAVGLPADNTNLAAAVVSQLTPPISPKEPWAMEKAQWMSELLDSDEMTFTPIELRYVLEEMIDRQIEAMAVGQAQQAQDQSAAYVLGNLPMIVGEQAMTQQNMALEASFQQQQAAAQAQAQAQAQQGQAQEQSQAQTEQTRNAVDAEATQALIQDKTSSADHERAMEQEKVTHKNAMEQARFNHQAKMQELAKQSQMKAQQPKKKVA